MSHHGPSDSGTSAHGIAKLSYFTIFLAGSIAMAAIGSQWWENHQLRARLHHASAAVTTSADLVTLTDSLRKLEMQLKSDREEAQAEREKTKEAVAMLNARADATKASFLEIRHIITQATDQMLKAKTEAEAGANQAIDMRYAQSIVSMHQSGSAAGVPWHGSTRDERIADVVQGRAPIDGPFQGKTFAVPVRGDQPFTPNAYRYIGQDANGDLVYDRAGGQSPKGSAAQPAALRNVPTKAPGSSRPGASQR